jgi:hypothetical protein
MMPPQNNNNRMSAIPNAGVASPYAGRPTNARGGRNFDSFGDDEEIEHFLFYPDVPSRAPSVDNFEVAIAESESQKDGKPGGVGDDVELAAAAARARQRQRERHAKMEQAKSSKGGKPSSGRSGMPSGTRGGNALYNPQLRKQLMKMKTNRPYFTITVSAIQTLLMIVALAFNYMYTGKLLTFDMTNWLLGPDEMVSYIERPTICSSKMC